MTYVNRYDIEIYYKVTLRFFYSHTVEILNDISASNYRNFCAA